MRLLPVAGTWSYDGDLTPDEWDHPASPFFHFLNGHGIVHAAPEEPFSWDGEIDGAGFFGWGSKSKHLVWRAAASALAYRLRRMDPSDRNIIAHSHGGQIACYAAQVVPVARLITVAMPVRQDMASVYRGVQARMGWRHIYAPGWSDKMQIFGALFDGALRVERRVLLPGVVNIGIPGNVGHSKLLNEPSLFHWWEEAGLIRFLTGEA